MIKNYQTDHGIKSHDYKFIKQTLYLLHYYVHKIWHDNSALS